ncbi:choice-of-anchor A family protein [Streptomyces sp. NBC_00059]|nr:choice-of-anchor A family protein [Streptomyces sp. NBC_00059]MCX5414105.1 choice-of-anchor A family protein [Streptomyces sp. NBC_00059]
MVNVTGAGYDQAAAGTSSFHLYDAATATYVNDDKTSSASGGQIRAKLLWNFPDATEITKNSPNAWPGSILAPKAALDLGSGGPVNGSVIARSLVGTGSAETHHYPFAGCLPEAPTEPSPTAPASTATPSDTSTSTSSVTETAGSTSEGGQASPSGSPGEGSSAPAATPVPSPDASGDLARTGADMTGPIAIGGAAVLAIGVAAVALTRRRRA